MFHRVQTTVCSTWVQLHLSLNFKRTVGCTLTYRCIMTEIKGHTLEQNIIIIYILTIAYIILYVSMMSVLLGGKIVVEPSLCVTA